MKLTLNISPCPNDTFMFDALINGSIDTQGLEFDVKFADIEELNTTVMSSEVDICKISYAIIPEIANRYAILTSGGALGRGNGPLLVGRNETALTNKSAVAVPGAHTTANRLMSILFPQITNKTPVLFSEIAKVVANGDFDAGILIHEGRFTYKAKGLELIADLGELWEQTTQLPLPLGAIVVNRKLPSEVQQKINDLLKQSIQFAFANPEVSCEFSAQHAQEMDRGVMQSHIELFVNDNSVELSEDGYRAVEALLKTDRKDIFIR